MIYTKDHLDLFDDLCWHYHTTPDASGEVHITCPECGAESSRKDTHCSFSLDGYHCFVCGAGYGLRTLADKIMMAIPAQPVPRQPAPAPARTPSWLADAEHYVQTYECHPHRALLWHNYKPVGGLIHAHRLGVGVLPPYSSRCQHERLIVPVMRNGKIVSLRGRAISCDCGKWLGVAGGGLDVLPLYPDMPIPTGQVIMIVENPVDALMVSAGTDYWGISTYTVTYWKDEWTREIQASRPELVVVAYDNDLAGNGGGARRGEMLREWGRTHQKGLQPPVSGGIRLVNKLLAAGLPAVLYDWGDAPVKADVGGLLTEGAKV